MHKVRAYGVALGVLACAVGCSAGVGEGRVGGTVHIDGCDVANPYQLKPTYFAGQTVADDMLELRVQHGSDLEGVSDGLVFLVRDTPQIARELIGMPLAVGAADSLVTVGFYLNESCPVDRSARPANLEAIAGTITWSSIYAQSVDEGAVEIAARFAALEFRDREDPEERSAILEGEFKFLYNRGRPAQRFP